LELGRLGLGGVCLSIRHPTTDSPEDSPSGLQNSTLAVTMHRASQRSRKVSQSLSLFFKLFKAGLLGVLAISGKEAGVTARWLPWVDLVLRTWQMVSFVTDSALGAQWPVAISPLEIGGSFTNLRAYAGMFPGSFFIEWAYYFAFAWVVLLVALLGWGIWNFARDTMPFMWPLRVLRLMANLSVGPLFIPLLQLLLTPLAVPGEPTSTTIKGAVGVVLALLLTALAFLFAAVYYSSGSLTRSPDASAHGRVNVLNLLVKLVATVVGGRVIPGLSVAFVASALLVCGLAWLLSYLVFLPCYQHFMNAANVGAALVFLWALLCLVRCARLFSAPPLNRDANRTALRTIPTGAQQHVSRDGRGANILARRARRLLRGRAARNEPRVSDRRAARRAAHIAVRGRATEPLPPAPRALRAPLLPARRVAGGRRERQRGARGAPRAGRVGLGRRARARRVAARSHSRGGLLARALDVPVGRGPLPRLFCDPHLYRALLYGVGWR
jgi:hypothetical protein